MNVPWKPRVFDEPVQCARCGFLAERRWLGEREFLRLSLAGIEHLPPGRCEPAEWEVVCPDCRAVEPFVPAVRCAECGERACICAGGGGG